MSTSVLKANFVVSPVYLNPVLSYPQPSMTSCQFLLLQSETPVTQGCIQSLLLKFSAQELIEVRQPSQVSSSSTSSSPSTLVISVDHTKLWAMMGGGAIAHRAGVKRKAEDQIHHNRVPGSSPSLQSPPSPPPTSSISLAPASSSQMAGSSGGGGGGADKKGRTNKGPSSHLDMEIENLLNQQSTKEQQCKKVGMEGGEKEQSKCI